MNDDFYSPSFDQDDTNDNLIDLNNNENGEHNGHSSVQEAYELTLPDDLQGRVEIDERDPQWLAFQDVARSQGLNQKTVDALTAMHFKGVAEQSDSNNEFGNVEKAKLIDAFNDGGNLSADQAMGKAQDVADWAVGLLKPDMQRNPELALELETLATTSAGVQLLSALKSRIGETRLPGGRDVGVGSARKSLAERLYPTMTNDPHR